MINYDSIISAYNDKPTLMEWLKKVEEALKGASATSFSVNKKGNATISFQIDFEDGTSLESGDIVLQQGESVTGASIVNGHLILTLSNGDNLDAGNLGAVSSFTIDGSQHLIVNYQDGTTNDLGAIFNGNVNISGILSASSVSTPLITSAGASVQFAKPIDVDVLTSSEDSIAAQKPVIEDMTGYTFTRLGSNAQFNKAELNYVGIVKNGNKLTLAVSGVVNFTAQFFSDGGGNLGSFYFPASVMSKLYTTTIAGVDSILSVGPISYALTQKVFKTAAFRVSKPTTSYITLVLLSSADITSNTDYYFRWEQTFLLSENLAA